METIIARNGVQHLIITAQDAVIKGFTIADNDNGAQQAGNGIYSNGDNVMVCNCILKNNRTGIYLTNSSQASIYNNTINNNGVGIFMQIQPAPKIINNIISNNIENGIYRNTGHSLGNPLFQYNDYYGNGENFGYYGTAWTPAPGTGDIYLDPRFIGGSPVDYHLTASSPCIDAGDPSAALDPDGSRADMGALFYDQSVGIKPIVETTEPTDFYLYPAYPNPFNPATAISYQLSARQKDGESATHPKDGESATFSHITLKIYNLQGQEIVTLVDEFQEAGMKSVVWDGSDGQGRKVASGIYVYRLSAGKFSAAKKMLLLQ